MPTQQDVNTNILTAQLKLADMVFSSLNARAGGFTYNYNPIREARRTVNAVLHQYLIGDYVSTGFLKAYDCLLQFIGTYDAGALNPNAGGPNFTIIVEQAGYEPTILFFADTDLLFDTDSQQWYLPWTSSATPAVVLDNGKEFGAIYQTEDDNNNPYTPPRIYGFASNAPTQIIEVTAI